MAQDRSVHNILLQVTAGCPHLKEMVTFLKVLSVCIKLINNLPAKVLNIVRCSKSHRLKI